MMSKHEEKIEISEEEAKKLKRLEEMHEALKETIEESANKILYAEDRQHMIYDYFGTSKLLYFLYENLILSQEEFDKLETIIEEAHNKYCEKAKKQFEEAHKKLF